MKRLKEGKDYSIHCYITKNKRKNPKNKICPSCSKCDNRKLCQNRRNLYTMNRCKTCKDCTDVENCDKFYIYKKYKAELLSLGRNATTGENIRRQVNANSESEALEKIKEEYIKISQFGLKEKIYQPNEKSIVTIASELEQKKLNDGVIGENTYLSNIHVINRCRGFKFANIPIQKVTRKQVEDYFENERIKANSSIDKDYGMLKRTFDYAERKKYLKSNIFREAEEIKKPRSITPTKKIDALTREEQYKLEQYMLANPSKYNDIIFMCLYTGLRVGEVLALTPKDIERTGDIVSINVNKTLSRDKRGNVIVGLNTKTDNGTRKIKLRQDALEIINTAIQKMRPNKYNVIFSQRDGSLYRHSTINNAFKRIAKNAKIRVINTKKKKSNGSIVNLKLSSVSTHMLRHSYATRCIEAGVPIHVLQKIMGHANVETTINVYGEVYDYYQQSELDKYDEYMAKTNLEFEKRFKDSQD